MVATRAVAFLSSAGIVAAQLRGQQGECFGSRFHNVDYDMSEEVDPESGYPQDFSISVRPDPDSDHLCPAANGGGERKGVCVGVNTNNCEQAKGALPINEFLSCENCFVGLVTDINYDLEVKFLKPKKISVGLRNMHLRGAMEFLAHQAASKKVAGGSFPIIGEDLNYNIFFMVGVIPVNINFKVPTELTYEVTLSESVDLRFGGDVDFDLGNHSIEWTAGQGWSAPSTAPSVSWTPVLEAKGKVEADMPIGLNTKLMVEFEKVLEYDIEFKPSLPLHAELDLDSSGNDQICLSSDSEFEIDHEARLRFKLFGKEATIADLGPAQLYSHHWDKIFDKCWPLFGDDTMFV
jgi:hypothetical protein